MKIFGLLNGKFYNGAEEKQNSFIKSIQVGLILTLSHPELLPWQVRLSVRQNEQLIYVMKFMVMLLGNLSVVKIYIIRPKPGPVAKNATPRPSGWESNPRPLDY